MDLLEVELGRMTGAAGSAAAGGGVVADQAMGLVLDKALEPGPVGMASCLGVASWALFICSCSGMGSLASR